MTCPHGTLHLSPKALIVYVCVGGGGVVYQQHLIILKTLSVKLYILTLFEMIFWNCRDNVEHAIRHYLKQLVLLQRKY